MTIEAGDTVWLLTVWHRGGEDTTVHISERAAYGGLLTFVEQFWDEVKDRDTGEVAEWPDDPREAIQTYFDYHSDDEGYTILAQPVGGEPE
jgi:hypothetical protein